MGVHASVEFPGIRTGVARDHKITPSVEEVVMTAEIRTTLSTLSREGKVQVLELVRKLAEMEQNA